MRDRLQSRGLVIILATILVLLLAPTPVPSPVRQAWRVAAQAAARGDAATTSAALQSVQSVFPWLSEAREAEIPFALASGDGVRALALLESGGASQTEAQTVGCWRAQAYLLVGRVEEALAILSRPPGTACPEALRPLKEIAQNELTAQRLNSATGILHHLRVLFPEDVETASLLGASLLLVDPASAHPPLAFAAQQGDPLATDLLEALEQAPPGDTVAILAAASEVFLQRAQWPMAAASFRTLLDRHPQNAAAHAYLGLALDQMGADGLEALETAVRLDPTSASAQMLLGLHWQSRREPTRALPWMRSAVAMDPENSAYRASLAATLHEVGDVREALLEYRKAAEITPNDATFWRLLAAYSLVNEIEVAQAGLPAARNALALNVLDASARDLLGYAHYLLGSTVTGERMLVRAIRADETSASAKLHYGLLLTTSGRTAEARAQLAAAILISNGSPSAQLAQQALAQWAK